MAQPSIIGSTTNNKAYEAASDSGTDRVFSVAIPAGANTVIAVCGIDAAESGNDLISGLAISGLTGATELHDLSISASSNVRATRLGIFDVRACGAGTLTVTASLTTGSSAASILGVVCTDGFVESFTSFVETRADYGEVKTFSGNMTNNLMVLLGIFDQDINDWNFTGTGVTSLFETNHSGNGISTVAASQETGTASKTIAYNDTPSGDDFIAVSVLLSKQPNAFGDIDPRGDIISHDIITN